MASPLQVIVVAFTLSLVTLPATAQDRIQFGMRDGVPFFHVARSPRLIAQNQPQQQVRVIRISPPTSGVRLLEELFQRVRSAPQVAMAKNLKQQQEAQALMKQGPSDNKGPTDYPNLAIRPKSAGKPAMLPQPVVALGAHQTTIIANAPTSIPGPPMGLPGGAGGGASVGGFAQNAAPVSETQAAPAAPPVEQWMGSKPMAAAERKGLWDASVAWHPTPTAKERFYDNRVYGDEGSADADGISMQQDRRSAVNGYVAAQNSITRGVNVSAARAKTAAAAPVYQAPPDISTATGRLMNLSRQLQSLQNGETVDQLSRIAEERERDQKAERTAYKMKDALAAAAPPMAQPMPQKKAAEKAKSSKLDRADKIAYDDAENELEPTDKTYLRGARFAYAPNSWRHEKTKIAMGEPGIAVLPPNVVTGIPRVRLGISESQANVALNSRGTTKHDKVDKWTILSWQRSTENNQTALQLYMRNGQLDAMRIFDPSLMAPDFGVRMNDDLSKVKERFGEPAFILPEPGPGAGQNYIYPISQVGFQLSRPTPDSPPRVMSVLIFNVK